MSATVPAPDDRRASTVDLDQLRAASRFGVTGYGDYVAAVMAESDRMFEARTQGAT